MVWNWNKNKNELNIIKQNDLLHLIQAKYKYIILFLTLCIKNHNNAILEAQQYDDKSKTLCTWNIYRFVPYYIHKPFGMWQSVLITNHAFRVLTVVCTRICRVCISVNYAVALSGMPTLHYQTEGHERKWREPEKMWLL